MMIKEKPDDSIARPLFGGVQSTEDISQAFDFIY